MILQALIFGGGHAGYANQPAYARVVELIIPSLMFGGIYLVFGLLPAIVLHFAFDVVWFALPLFVSTAPGIWLDRILVILLALLPLWIVLWRRVTAKEWTEIPQSALNRAWTPPEAVEAPRVLEAAPAPTVHPSLLRYVPIAGFLGLALWIGTTQFQADAPPLSVSRSEATEAARQALNERGIELPDSWEVLASVNGVPGQGDRFVWQEAGREQYRSLLGNHMMRPHWKVRFASFEGDVAERAEEYNVFVDNEGVFRFTHQLPEGRPGATIAEPDARILAHLTLTGVFRLDASKLKEVSATPSKLKERTDWLFTFADTVNYKLPLGGEARLAVNIAGDKVVDASRFIHVPEEWDRREKGERSLPQTLGTVMSVLNVLLMIGAMITGIVFWSKKRFAAGTFLWVGGLMLFVNTVNAANQFPQFLSGFRTDQPYGPQLLMLLASVGVAVVIMSIAVALIAGLIHRWKDNQVGLPLAVSWSWGISLGAALSGLLAAANALAPSQSPLWADYTPLGTYVSLLDVSLDAVNRIIVQTAAISFVFIVIDRLTSGWTRRKAVFGLLLVAYGIVFVGSRSIETIPAWLATGVAVGGLLLIAYIVVIRLNTTIIPIAVGTVSILGLLRQGFFQAYPSAILNVSIGIVLTIVVAWWLHGRLSKKVWI
jgi:MFS family permease